MSNITNIHDSFHCHQYYKHYVTEAQVNTLILRNNCTKYKTLSEITRKKQQSNTPKNTNSAHTNPSKCDLLRCVIFWLTVSKDLWFHLRAEAGGFPNVAFVLNIGDNGKSPCEFLWYYWHWWWWCLSCNVTLHWNTPSHGCRLYSSIWRPQQ